MTNQLVFNGTMLPVINHNNQIFLTSKELAIALGYADDKSVTKIFNRNQDEFTSTMVTVVNLTTVKNAPYQTRIFSLRGCYLIAMFSRTKVAKEFRKWVLDILDREVQKQQVQTLTINTKQQQEIKSAVNDRHYRTGEHYQAIYSKMYAQFNVPRYQEIKATQFDAVMNWLGGHAQKSNLENNLEMLKLAKEIEALYNEHLRKPAELLLAPVNYNITTKLMCLIVELERPFRLGIGNKG